MPASVSNKQTLCQWCRIRQHHQNLPSHWRKFLSRLKARTICLISLCSFVCTTTQLTQIVLNTSWHYVFLLERPRKLIGAQVVDKEMLLLLLINIILVVCVCSVNMYIVPLFLIIFVGLKSPYFCIETSSVITHQAFDRSARWCTREGWCTSSALWISPRR